MTTDEQHRQELWEQLQPERDKWKWAPRPTIIEPVGEGGGVGLGFPPPSADAKL